jgi:hypothetical protein
MRVIEERFQHVAEPTITLAPAVDAIVNLPVLASTEDGPGFDITNPRPAGSSDVELHVDVEQRCHHRRGCRLTARPA